jgi:transposase
MLIIAKPSTHIHQEVPMFYSGIDLHKDNCFITTINDAGDLVQQERVANVPEALLAYFARLGTEHQAVVESTAGWYWLNDLLEDHGIEMVLAHAKYLKAISYAKVKTDKVDSHTLATLLRMKLIPCAHKISRELRDIRDVMRARLRFVQRRTRSIVSVHTIGRKFNCDDLIAIERQTIPDVLPEPYRLQMQLLYQQITLLHEQILTLEKSLHPVLIPHDDIQRLLWVPGIGKTTAFTIYLEIDGIERFSSDKHFISYCRLVPGAHNSNRTLRQKSGSKDGNKYLKMAFSDAAVRAIQYYPEIRAFYKRMLRRTNERVARTIVAKELARIVYHILTTKNNYRGFKGQPISRVKALEWPRLASPHA